jgi:hypothetical protein
MSSEKYIQLAWSKYILLFATQQSNLSLRSPPTIHREADTCMEIINTTQHTHTTEVWYTYLSSVSHVHCTRTLPTPPSPPPQRTANLAASPTAPGCEERKSKNQRSREEKEGQKYIIR